MTVQYLRNELAYLPHDVPVFIRIDGKDYHVAGVAITHSFDNSTKDFSTKSVHLIVLDRTEVPQ